MPTPETLRSGLNTVAYYAAREIFDLWPHLRSPEAVQEALHDLLPSLIDAYGEAAATLGAEWYEAVRDERGIGGYFRANPAVIGNQTGSGGAHQLADWVSGYLRNPDADWGRARVMIDGGMQRRIANAARYTIMGNSITDRRSSGWFRYTKGDSCDFCRMLAGRGAVYTEDSAVFGSHDHCSCMAAPAWEGHEREVDDHTPTTARITESDRDRTREWINENIH